ncbi:MAG: hypothetical protein ACOC5L_03260 [Halobacteriota archaeon]
MPVLLERALKAIKSVDFKKEPEEEKGIAKKWLGAFKGAIPEDVTSTEYLKKLRETGYDKY